MEYLKDKLDRYEKIDLYIDQKKSIEILTSQALIVNYCMSNSITLRINPISPSKESLSIFIGDKSMAKLVNIVDYNSIIFLATDSDAYEKIAYAKLNSRAKVKVPYRRAEGYKNGITFTYTLFGKDGCMNVYYTETVFIFELLGDLLNYHNQSSQYVKEFLQYDGTTIITRKALTGISWVLEYVKGINFDLELKHPGRSTLNNKWKSAEKLLNNIKEATKVASKQGDHSVVNLSYYLNDYVSHPNVILEILCRVCSKEEVYICSEAVNSNFRRKNYLTCIYNKTLKRWTINVRPCAFNLKLISGLYDSSV